MKCKTTWRGKGSDGGLQAYGEWEQSRGTRRPGPHLPALLSILVKRGDVPGVLVWSQLTGVIRPGLAPVARTGRSKEPICFLLPHRP